MSDTADEPRGALPEPLIRHRSGLSLVWLIPLITALIGGWLVVKTLNERGPQITISFKTAEGIEAGKTPIKYKAVDIGEVEAVHLSDDYSRVVVTARITPEAKSFLRRDTRFWVVRPRLGLRGVSGLSTLLSGAFVELEPGQGAPWRHFKGLEVPPVVRAEDAGRKVMLVTERLGSVDRGSPVYYRGILAGEVLGYELGNDDRSVFIHAFVKAPYDALVQGNSRFWNVSGMDVSMGTDGVKVRTESIQSLLFGGIAFDTPDTLPGDADDVDGLVFTLYDDFASIQEHAFTRKVQFVLFFDSSVRGLNLGAPVEFKGIKIGSVMDVRLEFDREATTFRIPVLIEIEPERIIERGRQQGAPPYQILKSLVERGLRARLQTGSLLTGQLFVELGMYPDTPVRLVNAGGDLPELPTIPASLEEITGSVKTFLGKLERVEIDRIGRELEGTLAGANRVVNAPELLGSVRDLRGAVKSFREVMLKVDRRVEPISVNLEKAIGAGHMAMEKAQATIGLMDQVLRPDSPLQYRFIQMSEQLAEAARSVRALVELLERSPQSVLFGKPPQGEP